MYLYYLIKHAWIYIYIYIYKAAKSVWPGSILAYNSATKVTTVFTLAPCCILTLDRVVNQRRSCVNKQKITWSIGSCRRYEIIYADVCLIVVVIEVLSQSQLAVSETLHGFRPSGWVTPVVAPDRVLSIDQRELNCVLVRHWIVRISTLKHLFESRFGLVWFGFFV